ARRFFRRVLRQEISSRSHSGGERRVRQCRHSAGRLCRQRRRLRLWQLSRHRCTLPAAGRRTRSQEARGDPRQDAAARPRQFGLDRPLWVQYGLFMWSLAHGDLGQSFYYQTPVFELYLQRLPNSLLLAFVAMGLSLLIGIPAGILASVRIGGFWDGFGKLFTMLGLSLPSFLVGLVLILVFSVYLGWLPSSGAGTPF